MALRLINRAINNRRDCPVTTKVIFVVGMDYVAFLVANEQEAKMANLMTYWFCVASERPLNPVPQAAAGARAPAAPPTVPFSTNVINMTKSAAEKWYVELIGCQQVKPLSESNYTNYFQMAGSDITPWRIDDVVKFYASAETRFVDLPEFRALIEDSTFMTYHTSATSASGLVYRAISASPFGQIFTPEEMAPVIEAHKKIDRLDLAKRISTHVLVMTRVILDAADALPAVWYMGQRAYDNYSPTKYSALRKIFKRAMGLMNNLDAIEAADSIDELKDIMLKILARDENDFGGGNPEPPAIGGGGAGGGGGGGDNGNDGSDDDDSGHEGPGGGGKGPAAGQNGSAGKGPPSFSEEISEEFEDQDYGYEGSYGQPSARPLARTYGSGVLGYGNSPAVVHHNALINQLGKVPAERLLRAGYEATDLMTNYSSAERANLVRETADLETRLFAQLQRASATQNQAALSGVQARMGQPAMRPAVARPLAPPVLSQYDAGPSMQVAHTEEGQNVPATRAVPRQVQGARTPSSGNRSRATSASETERGVTTSSGANEDLGDYEEQMVV